MARKWVRLKPSVPGGIVEKYVQEISAPFEWVDTVGQATADYLPAVQATQRQLKEQLKLETTLVEIASPKLMQSKWVICIERSDG